MKPPLWDRFDQRAGILVHHGMWLRLETKVKRQQSVGIMTRQPKISGDSRAASTAVEEPVGIDLTGALKGLQCYSPSRAAAPEPARSCGRVESGARFDGHVLQHAIEAGPVEMPTVTIGRANEIHLHELRAAPGGHIPIAGHMSAAKESLPQPQFRQYRTSRWHQAFADSKCFRRTGID